MQSVLSKASAADVRQDPYPHLVVENALDGSLYEQLAAEFPARSFFEPDELKLANNKYMATGARGLAAETVSPLWKDFITYHMSADFYAEVVALFGDLLHEYYEPVEQTLGKGFADFTTGHRSEKFLIPNMAHPYDIMLDCQVQCDYTFTARPFRGPHVDSPNEIYAALLYMRDPDDQSEGGSLGVYRARDEAKVFPAPRKVRLDDDRRAVLRPESVELVSEVPYRANTLAFFVNTWRSLHCAMSRTPTVYPRRAVNIIGEICRYPTSALFEVERLGKSAQAKSQTPNLARRALRRVLGRAG